MGTTLSKCTQITNLNTTPQGTSTAGKGGPYRIKKIGGVCTTGASDDTASRYRLARVRSTAVVKSLKIRHAALGGGTIHFGLRYPDDARYLGVGQTADGAVDVDFFKASYDPTSAVVVLLDVTSGNVLAGAGLAKLDQPLWQAAGLSADPGGYIDIVGTVATTITNAGAIYAETEYVEM